MATIWTIGHSTRSFEELVEVLRGYGIEAVVDVRTVPRSRKNPQFNRDELEVKLPEAGIAYSHAKDLGGLRNPLKDSINSGWQNDSFRGFADHMQTEGFRLALERLMSQAESAKTAIMCAETLPWHCHRSLIADALLVRGFEVVEIFDAAKSQPHRMTSFAVVDGDNITYPPMDAETSSA